ncbi:MAG: hypothetical protein OEV93_04385 [Candidatus Moranbacteria bacterium]|nr:hypothetical protein [Candidatus Moranbacteria bacterium]
MKSKYYVWILVLLGLALATLVLTMTIQDRYDDTGTNVMKGEGVKKESKEEAEPVEVNLMGEGVDFDSDVLELTDEDVELNGFEEIDFEAIDDSEAKL